MSKLDELKALLAAATTGPLRVECAHDLWVELRTGRGLQNRMVADCMRIEDAKLHRVAINALPALIAAVEALQKIVKVSDQFVDDTGLKHGDPLTDAVDKARAALAPFGE